MKKIFIFIALSAACNVGLAQYVAHYFRFNNQAHQTIYVWVTQAVNMTGPKGNKPPYLALVIKPQTGSVKLRYTVNAWNANTVFSLAFCKTSARSCISTNGEYSALAIVPASKTQWKVQQGAAWSGMMLPLPPVADNVSHHSGVKWRRHADFPYEIKFWDDRTAAQK
mgnify:CR=1 FL=1